MSEFTRVFLILLSEAIVVAAIFYAILFVIALNLRLVPEPAEDEWMHTLVFIGRRRKNTYGLSVLGSSLITTAASVYALRTMPEAGTLTKFSPSASGSSASMDYMLVDAERLPTLNFPFDVRSGSGSSETQMLGAGARS